MRISCQKCAAAYAIDDRVITPKGVRAQCPRCRHLQLVKREDSPAPAAAAPAPQPAAPAPKPAVAARPAAPAPKPAAPAPKPAAAARPLTPSASLSDELFGDLGDLAPPPDSAEASSSSLLDDLASPGGAPAVSKDSLFGDLADLTASSPSNPVLDTEDPRPNTPGYSLPSGDLLFDDIVQPTPKPAAPMQARPVPQPKPAAAAFPEPSDDALFDFNAPPGYSPPPPVAAPTPAAPPPAAAAFPESSDDALFDFNAPPGYSAPPPVADSAPASADADPLMDFFGSSPSPGVAAPAPAPMAPAPAAIPRGCRECGKPLVDPFDQALGACEDCRQRAQKPVPAPVPENRSVEVIDLPPMDSSMSARAAAPAAASEVSGARAPAPALPAEPRSAARPVAARTGVAVSASSGRSKGPLVAVLVLLLLAGAGGAAYFFVPEVRALVGNPLGDGSGASGGGGASASGALPPALEAVLPRWQLMFVDAHEGDSKQLLEQGQALLVKDQRFAYLQAAESFQRAVLLDPRSDVAIGGYVQAISLGSGSFMDDATFQEARLLIEAAEGRAQRAPELLVAHANLLLARSGVEANLDQARKLAEEVLNAPAGSAAPKAEAHLVLGRIFLGSSRELATQHFESALAIASDLQRVHYYRALADETAGDYSLAIGRLQKRLEQDPEHWETRTTLARIYMEVGEVPLARQLYETRLKSAPNDMQAQLALAVMRYQVEGGVPAALTSLRGLLRNRDKYDERDVAELLLHLSTTERLSNNLEASAKAGREALQLVKNNPAVHLQLLLVALARKDAAEASAHLPALKGHLGDPSLEKMLEGRIRLLERKPAEAIAPFTEAAKLDPRRTDALLLAGVAAAQEGRRDESFRFFAQAIQADPLRLTPRPVITPFYLRNAEFLVGLEGAVAATARGEDDLLPHLYEGLLRFHLGDASTAEKMFKKVAEVDATHAPSFALRTLLAMGRKDMNSARTYAARAVDGGRQVAIAHLAQGLVLAESKQVEPAKRSLRDAIQLAPRLYAAEVKLDELEAASSPALVKERLVRLLGLDPSYLPAKRVLYQLDKRG